MDHWRQLLARDPLEVLVTDDEDVASFARRDLLGEPDDPIATLWEGPAVDQLLRGQRDDGS